MDTNAFQRLRRISQLGLASYVFPGATHTRFSHSLGAAYLAHCVLVHLKDWSEASERKEIEQHFNQVIIAALLHDVGHGPFSHSFERILKDTSLSLTHEDWTKTLILDPQSEIHRTLQAHSICPATIASIWAKSGHSDFRRFPRPYRQIVSSQLDVDRMDYLIRDSHFAGVAIGRFDAQYLINSIVIVSHGNAGSEKTLGITPKGVKAYEAFVLARQLMNRTVYYHHNVKVLEFMIEHLFRLIITHVAELIADKDVAPLVPPYFRRVATAIQSSGESKTEFMEKSHSDYVRLTEDVTWTLITALADSAVIPAAQTLAQKLLKRNILPHFTIKNGRKELLQACLTKAGFVAGTDFDLVDLKTTMYQGTGDEHVFILDWDHNVEEIANQSETISAFRDRPEAESLLIIIDAKNEKAMEYLALEHKFVIPRRVG